MCFANLRVFVYVYVILVILHTTLQNVEDPCLVTPRYAPHTKDRDVDVDAHADVEM